MVSACFSHCWVHFRSGVHQLFEEQLTPQIATLKSKGMLAEWGVISKGTDTSTPWLSLFYFESLINTQLQERAYHLKTFSFFFPPLQCELFLISVAVWKLEKKKHNKKQPNTLTIKSKLKDLWILYFAIGLLGRLAIFDTRQLHLADRWLKTLMTSPLSESKARGLQCTALLYLCSEGWG